MRSKNQATLIGLSAVLLWSFIVGLIRAVADHWGAVTGAALIYSLASVLLLVTLGFPRVRTFPRAYLFWGSALFVVYELCLSLSIGYASNARQAIEVGMVNYLWPTFTLVSAILFNKQKSNALVIPGFVLSMLGICWVLGGEQGIDLPGMIANLRQNPLSYGLAFAGALIWAAYCTVTARIAAGQNGVTLFFLLVSLALWIKVLLAGEGLGAISVSWPAVIYLLLAAGAMGLGYAAWNIGILQGNVTILAGASYFIPVISAALSALLLKAPLGAAFWQGAAMVCGGALLCWLATRARR
jgi:drug/metabolite transporter (DMT)-like permease